jgi:hypothetical protein
MEKNLMGNNQNYFCSGDAGNPVPNVNNPYAKKYLKNAFSGVSNLGVEELQIYFLSVLFMMSGFLLFIYGLFREHLYQFVMGFIFLIPGFILDNIIESDTPGE